MDHEPRRHGGTILNPIRNRHGSRSCRGQLALAVVAASVLAALGGCGSSGPLYQPLTPPDDTIAAGEVAVEIVDERLGLQARPSSPPTFTVPGQESLDTPAIPRAFVDELEAHLATMVDGTGEAIYFEIHVIKGTQGWSAGLASESEHAEVELEVSVFATETGRLLVQGAGKSWAKKTKLDASSGSLEKLFRDVFVDALNRVVYDPQVRRELREQLQGGG